MAASDRKKLVPMLAGGVAVIAVATGGTLWLLDKQHYESTDNAFVEADTVQVSPQVSGYVAEVLVTDNQRVEPGQVLAKIDPSTFLDDSFIAAANDWSTADVKAALAEWQAENADKIIY